MAGAVNKIKGLKVLIGVLIQCQELLINVLVFKQEAHGPHRSPEKTVQINYIITLIKKEEKNNNFMITYCFFI